MYVRIVLGFVIEIELNRVKNPWPEANQLLFASVAEDLNSGLP